jgi:chaperonin GroES
MAKINVKPRGDRVLVKPVEDAAETKGGIIIPDTAKEKPMEGKVIAVGPGKLDDEGKRIAIDLKVNDIVLLPKYGGTEVKINDEEYQIVREDDIVAVIG